MTETGAAPEAPSTVQHRSFSQIDSYRKCGWAYKLRRIDRLPERPNCAMMAGGAVHKGTEAVDWALLEKDSWTEDDLAHIVGIGVRAAREALNEEAVKASVNYPDQDDWKRYGRATKDKPKAEDLSWFREVGIPQSIQAYVDWRVANASTLALADIPGFGPAIEVPFEYYQLDGSKTVGWIDRVFTNKDKTGFYPVDLKNGQQPKTDEQLGLYSQALKAGLGWEPTWGYFLYGLKTGTAKLSKPLDLTHWSREKLQTVYGMADQGIKLGIFVPQPGEACFHCLVADHCEFYQAAL